MPERTRRPMPSNARRPGRPSPRASNSIPPPPFHRVGKSNRCRTGGMDPGESIDEPHFPISSDEQRPAIVHPLTEKRTTRRLGSKPARPEKYRQPHESANRGEQPVPNNHLARPSEPPRPALLSLPRHSEPPRPALDAARLSVDLPSKEQPPPSRSKVSESIATRRVEFAINETTHDLNEELRRRRRRTMP